MIGTNIILTEIFGRQNKKLFETTLTRLIYSFERLSRNFKQFFSILSMTIESNAAINLNYVDKI